MDDHAPDPGGAAREAAATQAVEIAAMLLLIPLSIWLQRKFADPDVFRTARMRAARQAERAAARLAAWSWQRAEQARQLYEDDSA